MSPRSVTLGLSVTLVAAGLAAPARAQCAGAPGGLSWTYYGLGGGGPYISYHPWPFDNHPPKRQPPTYGPIPEAIDSYCAHRREPPGHPGIGYGWFGYRTPSPRPKPPTVSAYPPPPEEVPAAVPAGACLRVEVNLPDGNAAVSFGGAAAGGTGVARVYESPPLAAGQTYTYTITATWAGDGKPRSETKTLTGKPGETLTADFTK